MRGRRAISAAVVTAALFWSLVGPARASTSVAPLIPRSQMLTVDEIRPGMKGVGKSVFAGTRIENFGVTVLGVLRRVDFGGDIILVRIDSGPPVTKGFGVVSGMSGSPVYVNGKLIGALAYTWAFAKRPVAGVTPIAQMLEAFRPGSSPAPRQGSLKATQPLIIDGQRIDRAIVATAARQVSGAPMALVPIATPVLVSGLSLTSMEMLRAGLEPLGLMPVAGAGSMGHIQARMVPGAAVGARLVSGDLDLTAVGTVTYVRDDVVLAFGHTMSSLGSTDVPLVAAYVHGVVPSAELSFKLASGGQTLGRFTEDRPWCVGGRLGGAPRLVGTTITVADRDRGVSRSYRVQVVRNRSLTAMLMTAVMAGAIRSLGLPTEGTTSVRFSLQAEGLPLFTRRNTYAVEEEAGLLALLLGPSAAVASATQELSQILDALQNSEFGEAKLSHLGVTVEMSKRRRVARLERLAVDKHKVKPGEEVQVTATLRVADAGRVIRAAKIQIPANCPPGRAQIGVAGGRSASWLQSRLEVTEPRPESMGQMVQQLLARPSNDELVLQLALPTVGIEARGLVLRDLPPAVLDVLRSTPGARLRPLRDYVEKREQTEWVVSGYSVVPLIVEGEEKDKGGRPPSPQVGGIISEEMPPGLLGLFSGLEMSARSIQRLAPSLSLPRSAAEAEEEGEELSPDEAPPMPSWEEVDAVGETEITTPAAAGEPPATAAPPGEAVGRVASVWRLASEKELSQGERDGVAVLSSGGLALAPKSRVVARVAGQCLWAIAVGPDGSIYTGSWADGALRRTTPDGQTAVVLETDEAAIQAIAVAKDGTVYAAAIPSGSIYRVPHGGKPELLYRLAAPLVWALAIADSGSLWAATGPEGKLFRISPDGGASAVFSAADRHITALGLAKDGTLYLATSPKGKVYALGPDGRARSVFEVDRSAVQSLAVSAAGDLYLGTSPDGRVLRVDSNGGARELLKGKTKHVLALGLGDDGVVYAATGPEAKVYAIWPDQTWTEVYDPKTAYLASMASGEAGKLYLTAADTGRIIALDAGAQRTGRFISPVRDAGASARWGAVRWQGTCPQGAGVSIFTRSGETGHPDATWSDWQPVSGAQGAMLVVSPAHRFLQCRLDLEGNSQAAPRVEAVEISYLPGNRSPEVSISVPKGGEVWSGKKAIRWTGLDPDQDKLAYEVFYSADDGATWTKIEAPVKTQREEKPQQEAGEQQPPATPPSPEPGRAQQPPAEPEKAQQPSAPSPLAATTLEWDTTKVKDSSYRLKVKASDRAANPTDPREAEAVSQLFLVDNAPPQLILDRARKDADPPPAEVSAYDPGSYLTSAELRIDGGEWRAAVAKDGLFDGQVEQILLEPAGGQPLPEGSHQMEVRCRDAAGNVATATLRYAKGSGGSVPPPALPRSGDTPG